MIISKQKNDYILLYSSSEHFQLLSDNNIKSKILVAQISHQFLVLRLEQEHENFWSKMPTG